jgi:hypothetical protein
MNDPVSREISVSQKFCVQLYPEYTWTSLRNPEQVLHPRSSPLASHLPHHTNMAAFGVHFRAALRNSTRAHSRYNRPTNFMRPMISRSDNLLCSANRRRQSTIGQAVPLERSQMGCPNCKLINPESAFRCDCGYRFGSAAPDQQSRVSVHPSRGPWYPNRKQWLVIWAAIVVGCLCLLAGVIAGTVVAFLIGGPLVWQLCGPQKSPIPPQRNVIYCGECGISIDPAWVFCPRCGAPNWKSGKSH